MMETQNKDVEPIVWDTGVKGIKPVKLLPMEGPNQKAPPGYPIPVVVVRIAEIQEDLQKQIVKVMSEAGAAREIAAATWLEEQLDFTVKRSTCIAVVKKIRGNRSSTGGKSLADQRVQVQMQKAFWTTAVDYELLKNVPGVYRLDEPGSSSRSIESAIEWPKNPSKHDPDIDNWMKQTGKNGLNAEEAAGKLISMGSRATKNVTGGMPSRQPGRPTIKRG